MSEQKCSGDLYQLVQDKVRKVDDGRGNFSFIHQTDVWNIMEKAFAEGCASKTVEAQNSTSNNKQSEACYYCCEDKYVRLKDNGNVVCPNCKREL